jgi:2-isopropylmalate synthase
MDNRIYIFDTTLRDGEQSPGCSMNTTDKLRMARMLVELGVDILEAGFPIASDGDHEAVRAIAKEFPWVQVAALARTTPLDIERAASALEPARRPRIHTFIATSDLHLAVKLRKTRDQVLEETRRAVEQARRYVDDVEFSAEDATRSDFEYLCQVLEAAVEAGATTINVPDTVGFTVPAEYEKFIRTIVARLRGRAIVSVHCHNDLGLAVANTIASLDAGARQVECTINGIGERAGNAALEEIVSILNVRKDAVPYTHGIRSELLYPASQLLTDCIGIAVQPNKAIVGRNAFAHEAGIHQDGVIKDRTTYEIMKPQSVGFPHTLLVLGKHSGRAALNQRYGQLGIHLSKDELNSLYQRFTTLADRKKNITDDDLLDLLHTAGDGEWSGYRLESVEISANGTGARSTVELARNDETVIGSASGSDPVTAICAAINGAAGTDGKLQSYKAQAVQDTGLVSVELAVQFADRTGAGRFEDSDLVHAAAEAYLRAANHYLRHRFQSARALPVESAGD